MACRSAAAYATLPPVGEAQLGESRAFWVLDQPAAQTFQVSATLRLITDHADWYVQDDRAERVSSEALERSASVFESHTFPTIEHLFGGDPAGFPGLGDPHVVFLLGRVPGVAGYFSGADTYPPVVHPRSNDREMIYVNVDALGPGQDEFDGIMAHEFQHLLHYARCPGQETWVDEGSSELAARVDGYAGTAPVAFSARPGIQLDRLGVIAAGRARTPLPGRLPVRSLRGRALWRLGRAADVASAMLARGRRCSIASCSRRARRSTSTTSSRIGRSPTWWAMPASAMDATATTGAPAR